MQRTYSSQLTEVAPDLDRLLEASCALFGQVCRYYYRQRYKENLELKDIKRDCIARFGINGRWFNGVRYLMDGKMAAAEESRKLAIENLDTAVDKQKAKHKDLLKRRTSERSKPGQMFLNKSKMRTSGEWREIILAVEGKLCRLERKLKELKDDVAEGKPPRICFGSRKRFAAQHHLAENGFESHREWRTAWHEARNNQIFLVGSKGESSGNQNLQVVPVLIEDQPKSRPKDRSNTNTNKNKNKNKNTTTETAPTIQAFEVFLTLPVCLVGEKPKRVSLSTVKLSKEGAHALQEALISNRAVSWRLVRTRETTRAGNLVRNRARDRALARKSGSLDPAYDPSMPTPHVWRLHCTIDLPAQESQSLTSAGAIGIDFNADHIAGCRIDASGNLVEVRRFPLVTVGKSSDQIAQCVADAVKAIVAWAKAEKLPVVGEQLDFSKKKKTLGKDASPHGRRYARMLSGLAYSKFFQLLEARCFDAGIAFHQVNPAYSSVIGQHNHAHRLGISIHQAAAGVIARRHFKFSERPQRPQDFSTPGCDQSDRHWHVWKYWQKVVASSSRRKSRSNPPVVSETDLPPRKQITASGRVSHRQGCSNAGHPAFPLCAGTQA